MTSNDLKWGAPPPDPRGGNATKSKWPAIFDRLRARPGEWALVHNGAASIGSAIKRGRINGALPGEFEAVVRATGPGKWDVYARYVGEVQR